MNLEFNNEKVSDTTMFLSEITPIEANIYYENKEPYINYIGTVESNIGKLKIHIPKIGLRFSKIQQETEVIRDKLVVFDLYSTMYIVDDRYWDATIIEREMTKEQIEKELGYKVVIK